MGLPRVHSLRVAEKTGLEKMSIHGWEGERVFAGGEWQEPKVFVCEELADLFGPDGLLRNIRVFYSIVSLGIIAFQVPLIFGGVVGVAIPIGMFGKYQFVNCVPLRRSDGK
jgi:hypothetical protein